MDIAVQLIERIQFPSTYGPDIYGHLPLHDGREPLFLGSKPPPRTTVVHYSNKLTIGAPLLVSTATLLYTAHVEELQTSLVLPTPSGPTGTVQQRAVNEFHYETRLQMAQKIALTPFRCCFDSNRAAGTSRECPSVQMDEEWYRMISCHSLRMGAHPLRGIVFQPGMLTGSWKGRLLVNLTHPFI